MRNIYEQSQISLPRSFRGGMSRSIAAWNPVPQESFSPEPEERATEAPFGVSSASRHPVRRAATRIHDEACSTRCGRACGAMERDPRDATEYGGTRCENKTGPTTRSVGSWVRGLLKVVGPSKYTSSPRGRESTIRTLHPRLAEVHPNGGIVLSAV